MYIIRSDVSVSLLILITYASKRRIKTVPQRIQETKTKPRNTMIHNISWTRGQRLGSGAYGSVYLAQVRDNYNGSTALVAVKSAKIEEAKSLEKERDWMVRSDFRTCPHILLCYGSDTTEEDGIRLYNVFLHYCSGGSIADLIKKTRNDICGVCLPEETVTKYAKSVLLGLKFLHESNVVHRDIKPHNLLLDDHGDVKIADFGLAKKWTKESESKRCKTRKGTSYYMAPEIVKEKVYGKGVDIWALGCTVAEMIWGKRLFSGSKKGKTLSKIRDVRGVPDVDPLGVMSKQAVDFVKKCMAEDPAKRWTAQMLLNHPFIVGCIVEDRNRPSKAEEPVITPIDDHMGIKTQECRKIVSCC